MTYQTIIQYSLLGVFHFLIVGVRLILLFVSDQIVHQFSFCLLRLLFHDGPIRFLHFAITEHLVQTAQCLTGLGKYHQSAYRTIQSVSDSQKHVSRFGIFLFQILLHGLRQGNIAGLIALYYF